MTGEQSEKVSKAAQGKRRKEGEVVGEGEMSKELAPRSKLVSLLTHHEKSIEGVQECRVLPWGE